MFKITFTIFLLLTTQVWGFAQEIQFTEAPEFYQLFARDKSDSSEVRLAGSFNDKYDGPLTLKVYRDGVLYDTKEGKFVNSTFQVSSKIHAGLYQYSFQLFTEKKGTETLCFSADSVVCGDAYIITGQSNSHPSSSEAIYSSPYCRSFGVKTGYETYTEVDQQIHWGRASGNCPDLKGVGGWFTKNPFGVGVWGMELMRLIVAKHEMPVCIINGGSGSSSIEENMLYPEIPSLETSFGRLAYRVYEAGLKDKIKAIFWHQGETNSHAPSDTYEASFNILLNDWKRVYTGLDKIYLFQIHPGCGGNYQSELREVQSQLASKIDMVEIMSTTGVVGHDGCHFSYEGYNEFAQRIFPLLSRDFYGEKTELVISPPQLLDVYYNSKNEIFLKFDQSIICEKELKVNGKKYSTKDQFFFRLEEEGIPQAGLVEKMSVDENLLILKIKTEIPYNFITWLPNANYQNSKKCYQGPWIRGQQNNLGALSFDRRPILQLDEQKFVSKSNWNGFIMLDSTLNDVSFKVVYPNTANSNRNWIWRARFWGHEPQTDIALLEQGFHVAYIEVGGLFGNEEAIQIWNNFYKHMIQRYNLNKKVVLEGMSRGGLIIYNWGNRNADKVACIYGDAPVCDFKSWPGGMGVGKGSPPDWDACLEQFGFTEEIALKFNGNPVNHMENLAKERVPILNVVGDADKVVPVSENTTLLEKRLIELGWNMEVIHKPEVGHHPHSLKDPKPIVDFILENTGN